VDREESDNCSAISSLAVAFVLESKLSVLDLLSVSNKLISIAPISSKESLSASVAEELGSVTKPHCGVSAMMQQVRNTQYSVRASSYTGI